MSVGWDDYEPTTPDATPQPPPAPASDSAPLTYATAGVGDLYKSADGRTYRKMLSPYANDGVTTIGVLQTDDGQNASHPNVSVPHFLADPITITAHRQPVAVTAPDQSTDPVVAATQTQPSVIATQDGSAAPASSASTPNIADSAPSATAQPQGTVAANNASPWDDYEPPSDNAASLGKQVAAGAAETVGAQLNQAFQLNPAIALGKLQNWLADKFKVPLKTALPQTAEAANVALPMVGQAIAPTPATPAQRYARTGGQFLPAAFAPGNAAARVANVILPTVGSETLGNMAKGTPLEAPARIVGAIAGGVVAPAAAGIQSQATMPRPNIPQGLSAASSGLAQIGVKSLPDMDLLRAQIAARRNPVDAAIQQTANELPVPVPMSKGQLTGEPDQQLAENLALRGGRGKPAQYVAQNFQRDQQGALRANVGEIAAKIGAGSTFGYGHGGAVVSDELNALRDAKNARVNAAYEAAREAESPAYLGPKDSRAIVKNVRDSVADYDPLNIPRVSREVDRLHATMVPTEAPKGVDVSLMMPADVRGMFASRSRMTNLRDSQDPVEASAAKKAVRALDASIEQAVTRDLFKGDPETVALWKKAVGERREFGQLFEGNDLVNALTAREYRSGSYALKVDPNDASNQILGRSNLGYVGRRNLYRDLTRLKEVLGPKNDGWNAIRAEVFQRMAGVGEGGIEAGTQQFSGVKFQKAWNEAQKKDPKLIAALFTPDERDTIDKFAGIAARATNAVKGGDNSSNTAVATRAIRAFRRLPIVGIEFVPFIDHLAEKIDNAIAKASIQKATYGAEPRRIVPKEMPKLPTYARSAVVSGALARPLPTLPSDGQ